MRNIILCFKFELSPGPQILTTSNDVANDAMICREPAAEELPKDILALEMVSMAGNKTGRYME